jgi:hypothetical protein
VVTENVIVDVAASACDDACTRTAGIFLDFVFTVTIVSLTHT